MTRRVPLIPTLVVLLAVPLMIGLGVWQLRRAEWKDALLAQLEANRSAPLMSDLPADLAELGDQLAFRRTAVVCNDVKPMEPSAGRDRQGRAGYRQQILCDPGYGNPILVSVGVAENPALRVAVPPGSRFVGTLVPRAGEPPFLLVAETSVPPLVAEAPPTVDSVPNNHRSYAVQWFGFATTLLIIYAIYVKGWRRRIGTA